MTRNSRSKRPFPSWVAAASTFYQWRSSKTATWTPAKQRQGLESSLAWALKACQLDPSNPDYAFSAAVFLLASGQRDLALARLRDALRLRPGFTVALSSRWNARFRVASRRRSSWMRRSVQACCAACAAAEAESIPLRVTGKRSGGAVL